MLFSELNLGENLESLSIGEVAFVRALLEYGQRVPKPSHFQHKFAKEAYGRRWSADFAWEDQMVIVEVDGGNYGRPAIDIKTGKMIRAGGRHATGSGLNNDAWKRIYAARLGWTVIPVTTDMLKTEPTEFFAMLYEILMMKGMEKCKKNLKNECSEATDNSMVHRLFNSE